MMSSTFQFYFSVILLALLLCVCGLNSFDSSQIHIHTLHRLGQDRAVVPARDVLRFAVFELAEATCPPQTGHCGRGQRMLMS